VLIGALFGIGDEGAIVVRAARAQDVIGGDQDPMGDGDDGPLGAAARGEAVVDVREVGLLDPDRRVGRLDQRGAQGRITRARPPAVAFAGRFIVARAQPGPARQALGAREMLDCNHRQHHHHHTMDPVVGSPDHAVS
jgi:hypothetical protein